MRLLCKFVPFRILSTLLALRRVPGFLALSKLMELPPHCLTMSLPLVDLLVVRHSLFSRLVTTLLVLWPSKTPGRLTPSWSLDVLLDILFAVCYSLSSETLDAFPEN